MLEGGPFACVYPWDVSPRLDTCMGAYVTRMSGRGFGVTDPGKATATFGSLLVEQAASFGLMKRLSLRFAVQVPRHNPMSRHARHQRLARQESKVAQ